MKQLISLLILMAFTFALAAQEQKSSYILRSGESVYKFNGDANSWSEPLEIGTILQPGDSIKSQGPFTLVIPTNSWNLFSHKYYTFKSCSGAQIPENLRKSTGKLEVSDQIFSPVKVQTTIQGGWKEVLNVELVIYDSKTGKEVTNGSSISLTSGINIAIINSEKECVFTYLLWKDDKWQSYFNKDYDCIKISPFSTYEESVTLNEPLGSQIVVMICSKRQPLKKVDYFINLFKDEPHIVDSLVCRKFNLVK